jgi:AcrR family transcriptional regulator
MVERPHLAADVSIDADERARPVLSRDVIAEAALRLTLEQPLAPLTLARLGAELGADPTAIYRHFRNRDELVLDLIDRMFGDAQATFDPVDDWQEWLRQLAVVLRGTLLRRPAVAAEGCVRFTGGPNERAGIEAAHAIFVEAGFSPEAALGHVRAFGELVLSHIMLTAGAIVQGDDAHAADMTIAERIYGPSVRQGLLDYEFATFSLILQTYIAGLEAQLDSEHLTNQGGTP